MMEQENSQLVGPAPAPFKIELSTLAVTLLKGVIYQDQDGRLWDALLALQPKVRDHVIVLGLELVLDESEGYAFLKSRSGEGDQNETASKVPRLITRRRLSFPVSLFLALLRRKLAEFDAGAGDTRLVLTREAILELYRVFLPDSNNEARLTDQIDTIINKIVELGFLRPMKSTESAHSFEVCRILKAFVDAQWLTEFNSNLQVYRAQLASSEVGAEVHEDE